MPRTVLITGFGPFPGAPFNPSGEIALRLARLRRPGLCTLRRIAHVFHTSYAAVDRDLPDLLARHRPDIVLMFGLAARTPHVRIETEARNAASPIFSDATGVASHAGDIATGAPLRLRSQAPVPWLVNAARRTGIAAAPSRDAGRYVCNYLYWRALEKTADTPSCRVLFVHVPKTRMQPRPRRPSCRGAPTIADLVRAGTDILLALAAIR
jgi:pyroglutamyl-peptidase